MHYPALHALLKLFPLYRLQASASMSEATQPILLITNTHSAACGQPPHLTNAEPSLYVGYFANEHGNQWLFAYDRVSRRATIRGGDMNWGRPVTIASLKDLPYHFNESERRWAEACWEAATTLRT